MTKVVTAEYDAAENALRLAEPLEGVNDREQLQVTIETTPAPTSEPSWLKYSGILSVEEGEAFSRALNEMFPPWDADE